MRIVKCKRFKRAEMEAIPGFVYCARNVHGYPKAPLHNPYKEDKPGKKGHGTREEVIALFRVYLLERMEAGDRKILDALDALTKDSVLGCWCAPERCHCEVIFEVWKSRQLAKE